MEVKQMVSLLDFNATDEYDNEIVETSLPKLISIVEGENNEKPVEKLRSEVQATLLENKLKILVADLQMVAESSKNVLLQKNEEFINLQKSFQVSVAASKLWRE